MNGGGIPWIGWKDVGRDLGLMVCESVVPELSTVVRREGWTDMEIVPLRGGCLPGAATRQHPTDLSTPALPPNLELHQIRCACAPALSGTVVVHDRIAGQRIDSIFQLFLPRGVVEHHQEAGAYLTTPGWLARWEEHLDAHGLGGALAREVFQEFARSVVLVDTGIDATAESRCQAFSQHLRLPWLVIDAGLDLATLFLRDIRHGIIAERRRQEVDALRFAVAETRANADLLFELQRELSQAHTEDEVLQEISIIFTTLFAPATLLVATVAGGEVRRTFPEGAPGGDLELLGGFLLHADAAPYEFVDHAQGFQICFSRHDACSGGALMSGFLFAENRDEYLRQALALAPVCDLAIARARSLHGIVHACGHCHQIRDAQGRWRRFEEYISSHSDAMFSHSVCPICLRVHYPDLVDDLAKDDPA